MKVESDIRQEIVLVEEGSRAVRYALGAGERLHLGAFVLDAGTLAVEVALEGSGACFELDALFIAGGSSVSPNASLNTSLNTSPNASLNTSPDASADVSLSTRISLTVRHLAPGCRSRQLVKGIVGGSARGEFSGRIHVAPGADGTDAQQHSRNIVLSDTAEVVSRPELEIYADDVRCVHGATVGQLDETAVYYMRQRGIPEADARRMQLEGFAMEIVDRLSNAPEHASITEKISSALLKI